MVRKSNPDHIFFKLIHEETELKIVFLGEFVGEIGQICEVLTYFTILDS